MKKYIVIKSHDSNSLEELVNDYIAKGYAPIGGLSVEPAGYASSSKLLQAMIFLDGGK